MGFCQSVAGRWSLLEDVRCEVEDEKADGRCANRDGHYGLWLDDVFEHGISMPCPTFGNECLSDEGEDGRGGSGGAAAGEEMGVKVKGKFGVLGVEVWCIGR